MEHSAARRGTDSLHAFDAPLIGGGTQPLAEYRGRLLLVVNIATECAFTPQLRGLQTLQDRFAEHGFTVLAFPSDQFHQDPGTAEDTREICARDFEVTFPVFDEVDVNGASAHPLWRWMCAQKGGVLGGRISWNFTKFLVGPEGGVLRRYAPPVPPARIATRIEVELGLR